MRKVTLPEGQRPSWTQYPRSKPEYDPELDYVSPANSEDEKLEEILLKRDRGEKLTDYEKMVLLFDAGRDSCHHPHPR